MAFLAIEGVAEPFLGDAGGENAPECISGFGVEFFLRARKALTEAVCKQFLDAMGTNILPAMMIARFRFRAAQAQSGYPMSACIFARTSASCSGDTRPFGLASRLRQSMLFT